ncbi:MAG TPA: hypothetical protein VH637_11155 [Streptosporangiaceae bacterium]
MITCLAALAAVGCASQGSVVLPARQHDKAAQAAELANPQLTAREQVLTAYTGYWQANTAAVDAGNAAAARKLLARYMTPAALPGVLAALEPDWARHAVSSGSPVLHIQSVKVTGSRAVVHDCVDLSHAGLASARTGAVYSRSFGSSHANYYADLVLTGHRWLVSNLVPVVAPCEP